MNCSLQAKRSGGLWLDIYLVATLFSLLFYFLNVNRFILLGQASQAKFKDSSQTKVSFNFDFELDPFFVFSLYCSSQLNVFIPFILYILFPWNKYWKAKVKMKEGDNLSTNPKYKPQEVVFFWFLSIIVNLNHKKLTPFAALSISKKGMPS